MISFHRNVEMIKRCDKMNLYKEVKIISEISRETGVDVSFFYVYPTIFFYYNYIYITLFHVYLYCYRKKQLYYGYDDIKTNTFSAVFAASSKIGSTTTPRYYSKQYLRETTVIS